MDQKYTIAVTRAGLGDWLLFDSFEDADTHPLVQYGDVIMSSPEDIPRQWTPLELPSLVASLEMGEVDLEGDWVRRHGRAIWARMIARASAPTEDPAEICSLVVRDRKLSIKERQMSDKNKKPAEKKEGTPRAAKKYTGEMKITLLTDKDDKPYGPKNNPKREGSKSADRFALYKNGMTVDQFVAAGGLYADVVYDVDKKFISVK